MSIDWPATRFLNLADQLGRMFRGDDSLAESLANDWRTLAQSAKPKADALDRLTAAMHARDEAQSQNVDVLSGAWDELDAATQHAMRVCGYRKETT